MSPIARYTQKPYIPRAEPVTIAVRFCCSMLETAYLRTKIGAGVAIRHVDENLGEACHNVLVAIRKAMMGFKADYLDAEVR